MKGIVLILFMSPLFAYAQDGWQWGKIGNNYGFTVDQMGHAVTDTSGNVFATMTNSLGDSLRFDSVMLYNPDAYSQTVVVKYDSSGNLIWATGTKNSNTRPIDLATDRAGNLYFYGEYESVFSLGTFTLTNAGAASGCLVKISPTGNVLWAINTPNCIFGSIALDEAGNIYQSGDFNGLSAMIGTTTLYGQGPVNVFLAKYNPEGVPVWGKSFGGNGNNYPTALAVGANGVAYLAAQSSINAGTDTVHIGSTTLTNDFPDPASGNNITYLAKCDSGGNVLWAVPQSNPLTINAMLTDGSGAVYMTGAFDSAVTLGSYVFSKAFVTMGYYDALIAKYDASGSVAWAKSAGSGAAATGFGITNDLCGNIWCCVAGSYGADSLNFDGHPFTTNPFSEDNPIIMIEYDASGDYLNGMMIASGGGEANTDGCSIAVDNKGNFLLSGDYISSANNIVFGTDTVYGASYASGENFFIAKYKYDTVCSSALTVNTPAGPAQDITLYPNPVTSALTIASPGMIRTVTISDLLGRVIYNRQYNSLQVDVDVTGLPAGVYLAKINGVEVRKFVKE